MLGRQWFCCARRALLAFSLSVMAEGYAQTLEPPMAVPLGRSCSSAVKVSFWGDINLHPNKTQLDYFSEVMPLLRWGDFNVANLEGVITQNTTKKAFPDMPFALSMSPLTPQILAESGIRHVTRGNNHSMDFGVRGMAETSAALTNTGISFAGVGATLDAAFTPMTLEKNNVRIAVLSATTLLPRGAWAGLRKPGVAVVLERPLREAIARAASGHDFVVVVLHWGQELSPKIRAEQLAVAQLAVKAGASLVVGHHAHVAQPISSIDGVPVAFGLGNFGFMVRHDRAKLSLGMHVEFCKNNPQQGKFLRVAFTPLDTRGHQSYAKPRPYTRSEFRELAKTQFVRGGFPADTQFFIASEDRTLALSRWMQNDDDRWQDDVFGTGTKPRLLGSGLGREIGQ